MNRFSNQSVSCTQMLMLLFLAMMSPFASGTVVMVARTAGKASFLSPAVFFAAVGVIALLYGGILKNRSPEEGLGQLACGAFGRGGGRLFAFLYGILMLLLAAQAMRWYSERFVASAQKNQTLIVYSILMAALVAFTLRRRFCDLARAGQIFFVILAAVLAGVYLFSLPSVKPLYVLPLSPGEMPGALPGGAQMLRGISVAFGSAFLFDRVKPEGKNRKRTVLWLVIFTLNAAVMIFIMTATFSPEVAALMKNPVMELARGLRTARKVVRIDAAVVALWTLSDFCFIALACRIAVCVLGQALALEEKKLAFPVAAAVLVLSETVIKIPVSGRIGLPGQLPAELILCFAIPVILYFVGKIREKNKLKKMKNNA